MSSPQPGQGRRVCPVCLGSGELVCNCPGEPGHDHMFIRDTTIYWCGRCMGKGWVPDGR